MYGDGYSIEDLAKLLDEDDPAVQKGLTIVRISPGRTTQIRNAFLWRLWLRGYRLDKLPAFPPVRASVQGLLVIGRAIDGERLGQEVGPSLKELRTPVLFSGITGTGKSTLVMILALAIQRYNENVGKD